MDKNIDDNDRIIIGVREWAISETLRSIDPWIYTEAKEIKYDSSRVVGYAERLEKYILKGIAD